MASLYIGHGELGGIPDHTAHRMMMVHGSTLLLRSLRGEPEPEPVVEARKLPEYRVGSRPYVPVNLRPVRTRPEPAQRILDRVAEEFGLTVDDILGRDRQRRLWIARTIAIRLLRDLDRFGDYSTSQIGAMMGNRDHSTICNALEAFDIWADRYPEAAEIYTRLSGELGR